MFGHTGYICIYLVQILYMQRTSVDSYVTSWLGLKIPEFFLHEMGFWCMDFTSACGLFNPKYSLHWLGSRAISSLTLIIGLLMVHTPNCFTRSTSRPMGFCYVTRSWLTFWFVNSPTVCKEQCIAWKEKQRTLILENNFIVFLRSL